MKASPMQKCKEMKGNEGGRFSNHLAAFIKKCYKRSDISMLELTPDFIKEYEIYLRKEKGINLFFVLKDDGNDKYYHTELNN